MPTNGELIAINDLVRDAWVVGIDGKTNRYKVCNEFAVESKALFIMP